MTGPIRVLFVCSGNICRSPFAEYLARDRWSGSGVTTSSAGTWATRDQPATPDMVIVGRNYALDLTHHRATPLDETGEPDLVYAMEVHHLEAGRLRFPTLDTDRIRLLDPSGIDDPYGLGMNQYLASAQAIAQAIDAIDIVEVIGSLSD